MKKRGRSPKRPYDRPPPASILESHVIAYRRGAITGADKGGSKWNLRWIRHTIFSDDLLASVLYERSAREHYIRQAEEFEGHVLRERAFRLLAEHEIEPGSSVWHNARKQLYRVDDATLVFDLETDMWLCMIYARPIYSTGPSKGETAEFLFSPNLILDAKRTDMQRRTKTGDSWPRD